MTTLRLAHAIGAASLAAIAITACTSDPPSAACETSAECASGEHCVDAHCVRAPDAGCGPECACGSDSQCSAAVSACVDARCLEGACFVRADDTRCAADSRCDVLLGCVVRDAGASELDAGLRADGGGSDGGGGSDDAGSSDDGGGDPGCGITSTDPRFQPDGFTAHVLPWTDVFYGNVFPIIDSGGLAPVGSFTFRSSSSPSGIPIAGNYISVPFVPEAASNYRLEWYRAQAVLARDYRATRPADAVYATISACPGDFRLPDASVPRTDSLSGSCREYAQDGIMYFGTTGGGAQCVLEAGRTYYLNILFANPYDGLDPTETTCVDGASHCDANFGS